MPVERVLTERELNRAVLARQGLLEPLDRTIPQALAAIGGLQAQYAPSMYVGLWSRMGGALERDALTQALERRTVVQATLMRITIHLVAKRDFWAFALATRAARRELWLRSMRGGIDDAQMRELAARVRERLATSREPISRKELDALVGRPQAIGVGQWIDLVRVPPAGTWERRRADLFAAAEDWLGPPPDLSETDARAQLVHSYLKGFGAASRADIASYTGLGPRDLAPILEVMRLRRFRSEGGDELLDVARAPLPDPEQPAPVRFLPTWDATLLVTPAARGSCPRSTGRRSFVCATRIPRRRSSSTARSLAPGSPATAAGSTWSRSCGLTPQRGARCATRRIASRRFTRKPTGGARDRRRLRSIGVVERRL
jgi:hypothetical protein